MIGQDTYKDSFKVSVYSVKNANDLLYYIQLQKTHA